MSFNATKCYYVRFTNKRHIINHTYHFLNHELEKCNVMKYLGVLINNKLTYSTHTDYTVKKANGTLYFLVQNFKHCSPDIKLKCYLSLICLILKYASIIWLPYSQLLSTKLNQFSAAQPVVY